MRGLLVGLAALAVTAGEARADDVHLDFTESLFVDWHWLLDDAQLDDDAQHDVVDLRNRLNARVRWSHLTFGLRLDAALFVAPPSSQYQSDVRPEELFVAYEDGPWRLVAGDDYLTIGRGMALSLRKLDEIGFSTNLRGVHWQFRGPLRMRVGAGLTNVVNVDLVEEKLVPDPLDAIVVLRLEGDLADGVRLGGHALSIMRRHHDVRLALAGVFGDDDDDPIAGRRQYASHVLGLDVAAGVPLGGDDRLDLFVEGDVLIQDETRATLAGEEQAGQDGYALYASATAAIDRTVVLLEGKRYAHYVVQSSPHPDTADEQGITQTFPYVAPPTLERIDQRVVNNTNVTGAHLRVDHALAKTEGGASNTLFGSLAWFVDAPAEREWTFHGYLGWERNAPGGRRVLLQAGLRWEEAPEEDITRLRMVHLDLDWFEVVAPGVDVQLHWSHELRDKNIGAPSLQEGYLEGTFYLSVNLPPRWSITGQVEYLTDAATTNPTFPGGFLQYKFDSQSFVRLFVGRSKGGLKCSGGICRVFPDFDGLKLETTLRF